MPQFMFPDNTVLVNFALLKRHDIVIWFTRGKVLWALSVARECHRSAQISGLEAMKDWDALLPAPLFPHRGELVNAHHLANSMRRPGETNPAQHMGEAETIAIASMRYPGSFFLTDDGDAMRTANHWGMKSIGTLEILSYAEVGERISPEEAQQYIGELIGYSRFPARAPSVYKEHVARLQQRKEAKRAKKFQQ